MLSQAAVEFALGRISMVPDTWRQDYFHGQNEPNFTLTLGNGTINFVLNDPLDGDLADNNTDPVEILGIGRVGEAVFVYKANYAPDQSGEMALTPGGWVRTTEP